MVDERVQYVPVGCGQCIECRKQKARGWQVRLLEDVQQNKNGKFITLTFSDKEYAILLKTIKESEGGDKITGYDLDNAIAAYAVRHFCENWRKKFKKSIRHWLVTELGHKGTQNIHLHGIIWTNQSMEMVEKIWGYGMIWKGKKIGTDNKGNPIIQNFVNEQTVNYIVKYISKQDEEHKTYTSKVFTSPGIGANYTTGSNHKRNKYMAEKTKDYYKTRTGHKIALPIYYRNKIYNEKERESLWLQKLDKQERWVGGEKVSIKNGEETYYSLLQHHRKINLQLGYGNGQNQWSRKQYEKERRGLMQAQRIAKAEKGDERKYKIAKWKE